MKTLINTLYIGLLIIAPVCASFFLIAEQYNYHCQFDPILLVMLAFLAVLFAPMILALIQNTAHKIAISLLNLAVLGSSNTLCKDGNQTSLVFVMGPWAHSGCGSALTVAVQENCLDEALRIQGYCNAALVLVICFLLRGRLSLIFTP
jgi:hypothetical protein